MRAARHAAPLLAAVGLAAIGLAGCGRFSDYAKVAEGNRLHERGDYQGAIVSYLAARRGPAKDFAAVIDYDVANVYARLGEYKAATDLYAAARGEGGRALVADSFYNEGVALFERGLYKDAWKAFRQALSHLDPSSGAAAAAKRNLELAWRAWKKSGVGSPKALVPSSRGSPDQDLSEQRILQRLETGRWRPGPAAPAASASSDY